MDDLAALRLMIEWGADEALEEAPIDRTKAAAAPVLLRPALPPAPARVGPAIRAQATAEAANTIEALRAALEKFAECPLATTATNLVFADGTAESGLVLVGEAPGAEEDLAGLPLVGPAGKLLDRMFASAGLSRETNMLITNLIPWRPPGNRPPTDTEIATCLPFVLRHLTLLRPKIIVTLGALSTRALTGREDGIRRLRGRWQNVTVPGLPDPIPTLPMLHPSYILRHAGCKKRRLDRHHCTAAKTRREVRQVKGTLFVNTCFSTMFKTARALADDRVSTTPTFCLLRPIVKHC